jgi:hypothetical protein
MVNNSLKLSHKNKSLIYNIFMNLMALSHSHMRLIYTWRIIEEWMGPNPNAQISNFTFLGINPKNLGFNVIWVDSS